MPRSWPEDLPPWRLWVAFAAIALGFVVGEVGALLVDLVGLAGGASISHPTPAMTIIGSVVFDLGFVASAILVASLSGRRRPVDFGFRLVHWRTAVAAVAVAAIGYYVLTAVYATAFSLHGSDKLPSSFGVSHSTWALVGTAAFVCALAPMAEEFFFRGFFFGSLRRLRVPVFGRELGPWIAAVITGILFGLAHTGSANTEYLIPLGFLGFVLCLVRWRTGSLYPGMALHSANNSLALGVQLHWSLLATVSLILGSWAVIAAIVGPLGARSPALA
ncbi:MAG: CPBP family intramembrane glutamic endopeptidase [Solirubrobacteraceae bacterium]